ncbi:MAG: hypothetical protein R3A47_09180 [Polyangiales bacterium]
MNHDEQHTNDALTHLTLVFATLLVCAFATYALPILHRFEPWTRGDGIPIARLYKSIGELPTFAGAGGTYRGTATEAVLEKTVNDTVTANATIKIDVSPDHSPLRALIKPNEYAGIDTYIEDPTGNGMRPFYDSLAQTTRDEKTTRIAHYGDSSIATDLITHTIRRDLQQRFGDSGHGFVLAAKAYLPYRHRDVTHRSSDDWSIKEIVRKHDRQGLYGYGGILSIGRSGSWSIVGTDDEGPVGHSVSEFQVLFQKQPQGGSVEVTVDDGTPVSISTRADTVEDATQVFGVQDGPHQLKLRSIGRNNIYGFVLERQTPGVVYDSLGLVGARGSRLLNFDGDHIAKQLRDRGVDLLVIAFGGNEASDEKSEDVTTTTTLQSSIKCAVDVVMSVA